MGVKNVGSRGTSIVWVTTPVEKKLPQAKWSEDAIIRKNKTAVTFAKFLKDDVDYEDSVCYVLYYDITDGFVYLKDVREDVLYSVPNASKAKGYTLALKLSIHYNDNTV